MARANKIVLVLAGAAAALTATHASAAEPFNGPYIGAEAGWQQDRLKSSILSEGREFTAKDTKSSFGYGGQIGYDYKVSPTFVIGAEASVGGDSGKIEIGGLEADAGRTFGLTARAGVLATPQTLVYAKGGWVNGRFSFDDGISKATANRDGWTAGAGIEQALTENVSARVEYRYSKFNGFDSAIDAASSKFSRNQVMAGVNFRF